MEGETITLDYIRDMAVISEADALSVNLYSLAIVKKVREHFQSDEQGNVEVSIIGHSFGAFLLGFHILVLGNADFDGKIVIGAGRIEMPAEVWGSFNDGNSASFSSISCEATQIGVQTQDPPLSSSSFTPIPMNRSDDGRDNTYNYTQNESGLWLGQRLQGSLGMIVSISELEKKTDLNLDNVIYASGRFDTPVGLLTTAEIDYLEGKDAVVYIQNVAHGLSSISLDQKIEQYNIDNSTDITKIEEDIRTSGLIDFSR